jgi:hypothetical protein
MKHVQIPWDPGGIFLYQLGGKPEIESAEKCLFFLAREKWHVLGASVCWVAKLNGHVRPGGLSAHGSNGDANSTSAIGRVRDL